MFRISFVVENFITFHSMNIVLGHTVKKYWTRDWHSSLQPYFWKMRLEFCIFWPVQVILRGTVYISQKAFKPSQC